MKRSPALTFDTSKTTKLLWDQWTLINFCHRKTTSTLMSMKLQLTTIRSSSNAELQSKGAKDNFGQTDMRSMAGHLRFSRMSANMKIRRNNVTSLFNFCLRNEKIQSTLIWIGVELSNLIKLMIKHGHLRIQNRLKVQSNSC